MDIWKRGERGIHLAKAIAFRPPVPQKVDTVNCGLFVVASLSSFLEASPDSIHLMMEGSELKLVHKTSVPSRSGEDVESKLMSRTWYEGHSTIMRLRAYFSCILQIALIKKAESLIYTLSRSVPNSLKQAVNIMGSPPINHVTAKFKVCIHFLLLLSKTFG